MKNENIDLGLAVLSAVRMHGQRFSTREIADVCGCSDFAIRKIETRALRKMRAALERRRVKNSSCELGSAPEIYVDSQDPALRWIPLKQWLIEEAERRGLSHRSMVSRYYKRQVRPAVERRVNARVILVQAMPKAA